MLRGLQADRTLEVQHLVADVAPLLGLLDYDGAVLEELAILVAQRGKKVQQVGAGLKCLPLQQAHDGCADER